MIDSDNFTFRDTYNVFISCPMDCNFLKKIAEKDFQHLNQLYSQGPIMKFNVFSWERDMPVGRIDNMFEQVLKSAYGRWKSERCDIFLSLRWFKLGELSCKEFSHFDSIMPRSGMWVFRYAKDTPDNEECEKKDIDEWERDNKIPSECVPIGGTHNYSTTKYSFKSALMAMTRDLLIRENLPQ